MVLTVFIFAILNRIKSAHLKSKRVLSIECTASQPYELRNIWNTMNKTKPRVNYILKLVSMRCFGILGNDLSSPYFSSRGRTHVADNTSQSPCSDDHMPLFVVHNCRTELDFGQSYRRLRSYATFLYSHNIQDDPHNACILLHNIHEP